MAIIKVLNRDLVSHFCKHK